MSVFEIPMTPKPATMAVQFPNGTTYRLRVIYQFTPTPAWLLDINDATGVPLACGIPLVTGCDLLGQFAYLGFGCSLYCTTDGDLSAVPDFQNLGVTSHLWLEAA